MSDHDIEARFHYFSVRSGEKIQALIFFLPFPTCTLLIAAF